MAARGAVVTFAVIALMAPASALGAYAPATTLTFDTYAPAAAPAVTVAIRQGDGEDTTRTVAARFPPGFTLNPAFDVPGCPVDAATSGTCPEESRVGSASVTTPFGSGAGGIFFMEDFRLLIRLVGLAGLADVRVIGAIRATDDGSAEITFDGLPPTPMRESRLALAGGPRAIFVNPRRCGRYVPAVRFVSHAGQAVGTDLPIEITGCRAAPRLTALRVNPRRPRSGRAVIVSWRLDRAAARTEARLLRATGSQWREIRATSAPAAAGRNRLVMPGLRPGRYRVSLRVRAADGLASRARVAAFRVHGPAA